MDAKKPDLDVKITFEKCDIEINHLGVRPRGQRLRQKTIILGEKMTKQADKDQACIHKILEKARRGVMVPVNTKTPIEGGLPSVDSFHSAMNVVVKARQSFETLPVSVREKFAHNPAEFLKFAGDPKNVQEMIKMGLAVERLPDAPIEVRVVPDATSPQTGGENPPTQ